MTETCYAGLFSNASCQTHFISVRLMSQQHVHPLHGAKRELITVLDSLAT